MNRLYTSKTITLQPGETVYQALNTSDYMVCLESNLQKLQVGVNDGPLSDFAKGFEVRADRSGALRKIQVKNPNSVPLTVTLAWGAGRLVDRRSLSNVPQGLAPMTVQDIAGVAYAAQGQSYATGGNEGAIWLLNPAGSGKLVIVTFVRVGCNVQTGFRIGVDAEAKVQGTLQENVPSLYAGMPAGVSEVWINEDMAVRPTPDAVFFNQDVQANATINVDYRYAPIVLPEGQSALAQALGTDERGRATFEIIEVDG